MNKLLVTVKRALHFDDEEGVRSESKGRLGVSHG
jgi:hypothetical protein